ncbi:MAG TPA: hypothetical protein VKB18_03270 [Gemmatimonadota bacterium]|nr:hypothetical protein [Gemmatimonadota bacterium]
MRFEDDGCGLCSGWRLRWLEDPTREILRECPLCGRDLRIPLEWAREALGEGEPEA